MATTFRFDCALGRPGVASQPRLFRALGGDFGQFMRAFRGTARGVLVELSFCHFSGAVVDNFLAWRTVEEDADGVAKKRAAIVVAAFPNMKHAARIAESSQGQRRLETRRDWPAA